MLKIILSGCCGKMGKAIIKCVKEKENAKIVAGVDIYDDGSASFPVYKNFEEITEQADVIIDFSNPAVLKSLLQFSVKNKMPAVIATTGLSENDVAAIRKAAEEVAIFSSFNMSLGVNLLISLSQLAVGVLGDDFDIEIVERHHNQKIDAPSGTALMIADAINEAKDNVYNYEFDRHSKRVKRTKNEIGIHSVRGGNIVGDHDVIFAGHDEVITISHSAYSKEVFAVGSVNAATFLRDKKPGIYNMNDLINKECVCDE